METVTRRQVEVGSASWTYSADGKCGDLYFVEQHKDGSLIAVVYGIGHGAEAEKMAKIATSIIKDHVHESLEVLIRECHEGLRATRGAVLALALIDTRSHCLTWTGVGNVEGKLFSRGSAPPTTLLSTPGTLGHGTIEVRPSSVHLKPGDTLILATDGVRSDFYLGLDLKKTPQELADHILKHSAVLKKDDALVVVARHAG